MVEFSNQRSRQNLVADLAHSPSGGGRPQTLELLGIETDLVLRSGQPAPLLDGEKTTGAFATQPNLRTIAGGEIALADLNPPAEREINRHLLDQEFPLDLESGILTIQSRPPS